jgi:hypothetical protein
MVNPNLCFLHRKETNNHELQTQSRHYPLVPRALLRIYPYTCQQDTNHEFLPSQCGIKSAQKASTSVHFCLKQAHFCSISRGFVPVFTPIIRLKMQ